MAEGIPAGAEQFKYEIYEGIDMYHESHNLFPAQDLSSKEIPVVGLALQLFE
ncbi:hypothetical protein [Pontibacter beigongshangensis]|uniref:hypothetical protein n=1 Tax=Pontibacter beigongshangensis TaxID=2574733 RepID=UPI00164F8CB9|nr:hypothetical protein [Pontibacter beigongshangensis]